MRISDLKPADPKTGYPGQRFRSGEEEPYKYGRLLRLGTSSAVVRFDGTKRKHITVRRGREVVREKSFDARTDPVAISLHTTVQPVEEE